MFGKRKAKKLAAKPVWFDTDIDAIITLGSTAIPAMTEVLAEQSARRLYALWFLDRLGCADPALAPQLAAIWQDEGTVRTAELLRLTMRVAPDTSDDLLQKSLAAVLDGPRPIDRELVDRALTAEAGRQLAQMATSRPQAVEALRETTVAALEKLTAYLKEEAADTAAAIYNSTAWQIAAFAGQAKSLLPLLEDISGGANNPYTPVRANAAIACIVDDPKPLLVQLLDSIASKDAEPMGTGFADMIKYVSSHSAQSIWGQGVEALARSIGPRETRILRTLGEVPRYKKAVDDVLQEKDRRSSKPYPYFAVMGWPDGHSFASESEVGR